MIIHFVSVWLSHVLSFDCLSVSVVFVGRLDNSVRLGGARPFFFPLVLGAWGVWRTDLALCWPVRALGGDPAREAIATRAACLQDPLLCAVVRTSC